MPALLLLALCQAESTLNPHAARYGIWPDVSFGMTQQTVQVAGGYGIGDGSNTPDNIANVRATLWSRPVSIDLGATILAGCLRAAGGDWLQALIAYNSGSPQPEGNWYWQEYQANIQRYRDALEWARGLQEQG